MALSRSPLKMCDLSPRRNCSLSTLAEKKSTWMRSMITAMANTRQMAIGYIPGPPPFQCCARLSKNWFMSRLSPERVRNRSPRGWPRPPPPCRATLGPRAGILGAHPRESIARPPPPCGTPRFGRLSPQERRFRRVWSWARFPRRMARGPEFPKVRHLALSTSERIARADGVIVPFEVAQPEPPEPDRGAPEGALPPASADPALR